MTSVQAVDFKRPVGMEISQLQVSSGPFWTHNNKPKQNTSVFPTYFIC